MRRAAGDGTHAERILATLSAAIGTTVAGEALLQAMYGPAGRPPNAVGTLRVNICHLRTKLPADRRIVNVRGRAGAFGYRLEVVG
jgi:DNA-binding response OmpR family regulator